MAKPADRTRRNQVMKTDPEITIFERMGFWASENGTALTVVAALAAVAFVGYQFYMWQHHATNQRLTSEYGQALAKYTQGVGDPDTAVARDQLVAAVDSAKRLADAQAAKPMGRAARLLQGNSLYYLSMVVPQQEAASKLQDARKVFEEYVAAAASEREKAEGNFALGNTLESLSLLTNDLAAAEAAEKAYREVATAAAGTYLEGEALLASGRLAAGQAGRGGDAEKFFAAAAGKRSLPTPAAGTEGAEKNREILGERNAKLTAEQAADLRAMRAFSHESYAREYGRRVPALTAGAAAATASARQAAVGTTPPTASNAAPTTAAASK